MSNLLGKIIKFFHGGIDSNKFIMIIMVTISIILLLSLIYLFPVLLIIFSPAFILFFIYKKFSNQLYKVSEYQKLKEDNQRKENFKNFIIDSFEKPLQLPKSLKWIKVMLQVISVIATVLSVIVIILKSF